MRSLVVRFKSRAFSLSVCLSLSLCSLFRPLPHPLMSYFSSLLLQLFIAFTCPQKPETPPYPHQSNPIHSHAHETISISPSPSPSPSPSLPSHLPKSSPHCHAFCLFLSDQKPFPYSICSHRVAPACLFRFSSLLSFGGGRRSSSLSSDPASASTFSFWCVCKATSPFVVS